MVRFDRLAGLAGRPSPPTPLPHSTHQPTHPPTPSIHSTITRRVATGVAVAFTAFQLVLRTDYGEKDHVFKPVGLYGL